MSTLYELHDELEAAIAEHVDPDTGEITEEGLAELAKVEMDFKVKALNVAAYIRSLQIKADGYKGEANSVKGHMDALKAREQACLNQAAYLTTYLQDHLDGGQKLEDERVRISWGTASRVELKVGLKDLPEWALHPPAERRANLKQIRECLSPKSIEHREDAMKYAYLEKRRYIRIK